MKIFQILALIALTGTVAAADISPRIVGGQMVTANRYPFMASVYFYNASVDGFLPGCGGSFIGGKWILTAAHCVIDAQSGALADPGNVGVVLGTTDLTDDTPLRGISRIVAHPDYSRFTFLNDIALLELSNDYQEGKPISLPAADSNVPTDNENGIVAGWGTTEEDGPSSPDLLEVSLPIISNTACLPTYPGTLDDFSNFCAGGSPAGGEDSCQGDSGGPLFVTRGNVTVQAGIVSYGEGCARPSIPGVYTRLSSYTAWVNTIADRTEVFNSDGSTPPVLPTTNPTMASSGGGGGALGIPAFLLLLSWYRFRNGVRRENLS